MLSSPDASSHHAELAVRAASSGLVLLTLMLPSRSVVGQTGVKGEAIGGVAAEQPAAKERSPASKTILLVRTPGDDAVMNAVRVELRGHGWRIIEVRLKGAAVDADSLSQLVSDQAAAAALRVKTGSGQIELYIARASGDVEETIRSQDDSIDGQVLALRTTETLRAHGLDLGPDVTRPVPRESSRAATSNQPALADRNPSRKIEAKGARSSKGIPAAPATQSELGSSTRSRNLWLDLGPAVIGSSGGWRISIGTWVGLRLELSPRWSISATGMVPWTSHSVTAVEGRATVTTDLLGASIAGSLLKRPFGSGAVGLGAAMLVTTMRGTAQPGYLDRGDVVVTQAPYAYLRVAVVLHRNWQCFSTMLGGLSIPEVSVAFGDRVIETWGSPFAVISLGVETRAMSW